MVRTVMFILTPRRQTYSVVTPGTAYRVLQLVRVMLTTTLLKAGVPASAMLTAILNRMEMVDASAKVDSITMTIEQYVKYRAHLLIIILRIIV